MKHTREITIELEERKGTTGTKSFSAVISTESGVQRYSYEHGDYLEVLSHASDAIDLSRAPLPLLESHDMGSLPIGLVSNLRVVGKKLKGIVEFGSSARAVEIAADVEAGIVRNLSIGYSIEEGTETRSADNTTTLTATKWMPHEVSCVAVGADSGAGFNRSKNTMTVKTTQETEAQTRAIKLERKRISDIQSAARVLKVDEATVRTAIDGGTSADIFRESNLETFEARTARNDIPDAKAHPDLFGDNTRGYDGGSDFRSAAVDALLLRSGVNVRNAHPAARDISGSIADLARTCVSRAGVTVSGGQERLIKRAFSTDDFPYILQDAVNRATLQGYEDEPSSHRAWVHVQPVKDFRPNNRAILGSAPALDHVLEGAEYTEGSMSDGGTSYKVLKYGKIVSLSWEMLVNDDLGSLLRIQPAMGMAARRKEADLVYAMFAENSAAGPTMQDGTFLFHADHGNIATGGALSATTLGEARAILRKVTALGGGYMSLVPRFMLVPPEIETDAEILLAAATKHVSSTSEAGTPQWLQKLELVVEPRLASNAFYLAAGNSQVDTAELGLLEENMQGPTLDKEEGFGVDSFAYKVRHVAGAKFLDWRGMVKIPLV